MTTDSSNDIDALKRQLLLRRLNETAKSGARTAPVPAIVAADRSRPLPISWAQQRLWFLDQLDRDAATAYHIPTALRLTGQLNHAALRAALDRVVARHEALRTTFANLDGEVVQCIAPASVGFALREQDLSAMPAELQAQEVERIGAEEFGTRFDLATDPLIRGQLLRLAADQHVLLVTQHHIISDGWSIGILVKEFSALYAAFCQGQDDPLPPLAIQAADHAAWQRGWLQGAVLQTQVDYWKQHLTGAPPLLDLPLDRPRPALQSHAGASHPLTLPRALSDGLRQLGTQHGATLFMTLLAGWSAFLSRISGEHDIVVGTAVANRQRAEIAPLIGFFVNTLALRTRLDDDPSVAALLARTKVATLAAYAHQDLPFDQIVDAVRPLRNLSHSPLFQVMLSLNNTPREGELALPGLRVAPVHSTSVKTHFDLTLALNDTGAELTGCIEYASDLFDAATIERMASHLCTFLGAMVADSTQRISMLAMLDEQQRRQVLVDFNASAAPGPQILFQHLVEQHVRSQPDALAVQYEQQQITYAQLNRRANGLAHLLIGRGIGPGQRVAICIERSIDMIVAILGVLKAGAAWVPFDPNNPAERLAYMWKDSTPVALLTSAVLRERMQALLADTPDAALLVLDDIAGDSGELPDPVVPELGLESPAYVIYTSGSTGLPKGVLVAHRGLANLPQIQRTMFVLTPQSRILQFSSFVFDASVWETVMALAHGASLHMGSMESLYPGVPLATMLRTRAITHASLPSSALAVMSVNDLSSRLTMIVAGDAFAATLANQWAGSHTLFNGYGPTETTVCATMFRCLPNHVGPLPIGRPLPNMRVYLLDKARQPVPIGVTGELYVGGTGVALGYLNRPQLTGERFIADTFGGAPGSLAYRTGDLCRWRSDGELEFLGRTDFQVKIRGFRVELGEIETKLRACDHVSEATVIAREDDGNKRLVAYLVMQEGATLDAAVLRRELALTLAEHMLPSAFVGMTSFPLTGNGKVDHRALPAPDRSALPVREYTAPEGTIETVLAQIWQTLLGLDQVGRFDKFFEIGGHSLLAVQVVSALRRELGVEIPLRDVFQHGTLAALAEVVAAASGTRMSPLVAVDRNASLPASFAQQRLWFIDQLDHAAGAAYHIPVVLRLTGTLDVAVLRATFDRIVARHEILRTSFALEQGKPVQRIAPAQVGMPWRERDLSTLDDQARASAVAAICAREAEAPFALASAPLIRAQLLRLAEDEVILLVTQHHIISDAWSIGILVREVEALYPALLSGQADPLPALTLQYADYAAWQHGWLQGEQLDGQIGFWKDYLAGAPGVLALPTDHPRPALQSYVGDAVPVLLAPELVAGLKQLSQRHGATLFMTLLAGWSLLLSRLSGQQELVIGTPVANRARAELEGMIGFFVNTLALRVDIDASTSVAQLLGAVKASALAAYAHQELPFEQVVDAVQPSRSLAHAPLFQVMLALNNTPLGEPISLPGVTLSPVEQAGRAAHFDLTLSLGESGGAVEGRLEYASDLFERATVERMVSGLQLLLAAMVADDNQHLCALPMMSAAERHQVVVEFNQNATPAAATQLIHVLVEEQAHARPDALALVHEHGSVTYGDLNRRANQLAHYLQSIGVKPEDRVAVCLERGVDLVVGILAILKAGGAYVPLDAGYPAQRLAVMLQDCAPVALLTQLALCDALPTAGMPAVIVLDDQASAAAIASQPAANPVLAGAGLDGSRLAYVIYTSGSSGTPKGVMIEHRNVVNLVLGNTFAPLDEHDCLAHCASPAFDAATWEIWGALAVGARICIVSQAHLLDPAKFAADLTAGGVTALWLTVGLFNEYVDRIGAALAGLRHLLIGGDVLDPRKVARVLNGSARPQRVVNGYGPTETTTFAITGEIGAVAPDARSIPIGRPIANAQIYILEHDMRPAAVGVAGEIYIGGAGVGRGYLNLPEMTAERFVDDVFKPHTGARLYRSGDLGRWRADGSIEFLGRNDSQVKIRGFRIELGEIEACLAACADVREAVVIAREDQPGSKALVAYLTAQAGHSLEAAQLRSQLAEVLADYMLPSAFVVLQTLPLTPNGKLDRRALPAPQQSALPIRSYVAPEGDFETAIATIWQDLLQRAQVGRHDHFFELGGHSLLAVQLVSRLRESLDVEVALRDLFAHPTLSALAQVVRGSDRAGPAAIMAADRSRPLPLSWAQQRLWFLDQLDHAAGAAYHMPAALRLKGDLDLNALQGALDTMVARHEVLRTSFPLEGEQAVQKIARPDVGLALHVQDVRTLPDQHQAVLKLAQDEASVPFDLATGPLIRAVLLQLGEDEHILLLTQHHIISDGWSIGVLVRELSELYCAFSQGHANPLPALPIQYADYAAWQRGWLQGDVLQEQLSFWTTQLAAAPALLELPTDRVRPALQSHAGDKVALVLDATLTAGLRALSRRHGTTMFMTLLAVWSVLLARVSGQRDVVIGTPVANRNRGQIESLIGFFVNTLALRVKLDGEPGVAQLLAQIKADTLAAYAHQDLPFEQVVEALNPRRSMGHSPVFQVMLSLNNTPEGGALSLPGLTLSSVELAHATTHFDLTLALSEQGDGITGSLEYASDLFDRASMERLLANFTVLAGAMVSDDHANDSVMRLPLLDAREQHRLLVDFNATRAQLPQSHTIQQLFEEQAHATPDAVALIFGEQRLTYCALNRRANHVAHALLGLGIEPDQLVAICLERSIGMVVAMLGILKAGAAYLPLDPSYPAERQSYMLADAKPAALITEAALQASLAAHALPTLLLGEQEHDTNPQVDACTARSLAYVIYTSGSTGQPKGVMVEQRSVVRLVRGADYITLDADSVVAQASNSSFDAATFEIWGALLNGGKLVYVDKECLLTPSLLSAQLERDGINVLFVTTALFNRVAQEAPGCFGNLKTLLFGGEAVSHAAVRTIAQSGKPAHLLHVYGPTENTTFSTWFEVEVDELERSATVPIGASLGASTLYVLDEARQLVPAGAVGELFVGGPGLARGYLGQPELTRERFVPNPLARTAGERLYRTGDLVRWNSAGQIEYIGRNDFQVKIRGFRIEPGEIEVSLRRCDKVRDAIVVASAAQGGEKRLTAYVVASAGTQLSIGELRQQLGTMLADYMIPAAFVLMPSLPLNANGKVDRAALPAPDMAAMSSREYEAPRGRTEELLAHIWQSLLSVERVGRQDNFFELGGHSLLAVQLRSALRLQFKVEIAVRDVFTHPALADLAAVVEAAQPARLSAIAIADRGQALRLSWAQQRLWFLDQLDHAAGAAYHMPSGLRLSGILDKAALQATLDRLVARHEILRTTFMLVDGEPRQAIAAAGTRFELDEHDLSHLTGHERAFSVSVLSSEFAVAPFDLAAGPLIRGQLLRLSETEHVLLINQHHIISDGWSIGILVREVTALYTAFSQGQADPLPALPIQYADYSEWQRNWLQGEVLQQQIRFWKSHLTGAPALLELPTDRPRPALQSYAGANVPVEFDAALTAGLRTLCQRHGTTMFMTVLAAWSVLLGRLSGQQDVVIGTAVANRQRSEIESLIGFFVNTLALRVRMDDDPSVGQLLAQIKADTLRAYEHQDLPFEQVVEAVNPVRGMGHSAIFQAMLTLNNTPEGAGLTMPGLTLNSVEQAAVTTHFDVTLALSESGERMIGALTYASDLFDQARIERMLVQLKQVLQAMVADDAQAVSALPLLDPAQREQLLVAFNDTAMPFPREFTLPDLFEEQARLQPDAVAVVYEAHSLSYAELNGRANQVAHRLLALGVQPDDRVALCVERSLDMIVGLVGILKAGAAYVPMEPANPRERLLFMLADSAPVALLTQAALAASFAQLELPVLCLDDAALATEAQHDPVRNSLHAQHLAYVIYTSGSTGSAKGVMVEHRSAVNFWNVMRHSTHAQCPAQSRIALNASFAFDMSLKGILQLLSGHAIHIVPQQIRADGARFLQFLARHRIDAFDCTPSQLDILLNAGLLHMPAHQLCSVLIGGEAIGPAMWDTLRGASGIGFFNMYGPTECTVDATLGRIGPASARAHIGAPLGNAQIYILDQRRQPVPLGVVGEIHIAGTGLARGYLNHPAMTAERFIAHPFSADPGARLYRSGDLGCWLDDGTICYIGRNDSQVKLRGFRVELGEIESRLRTCAGVSNEAAVVVQTLPSGEQRLLAYYVAQAGAQPSATELRHEMARTLAEHMIPVAFVRLDALPQTQNGKLDRRALPQPDLSSVVLRSYVAPQGEVEIAVAALWQTLLKVERVGRDDHFFELGGHSLLAVQLMARIAQVLGVEVALRELFSQPTLRQFALAVQAQSGASSHSNLVALRPQGSARPLFLIHPGEGEVGYARELTPWLAHELPVYALSALGFMAGETPLYSVPEMATAYIGRMRQVQPHGPYRVAGWSAGGTIAYEIAAQLHAAGEAIDFLGLIDTVSDYPPLDAADFDLAAALQHWLGDDLEGPLRDSIDAALQAKDVDAALLLCVQTGAVPPLELPVLRRHLAVRHAITVATRSYARPQLALPVSLFTAVDARRSDPTLGWRQAAAEQLRWTPIGGDHFSIMDSPHIERLGTAISRALQASSDAPRLMM